MTESLVCWLVGVVGDETPRPKLTDLRRIHLVEFANLLTSLDHMLASLVECGLLYCEGV